MSQFLSLSFTPPIKCFKNIFSRININMTVVLIYQLRNTHIENKTKKVSLVLNGYGQKNQNKLRYLLAALRKTPSFITTTCFPWYKIPHHIFFFFSENTHPYTYFANISEWGQLSNSSQQNIQPSLFRESSWKYSKRSLRKTNGSKPKIFTCSHHMEGPLQLLLLL